MTNKATRCGIGLIPEKSVDGLENFRQMHINHPGRNIPFHISLLTNFYLPDAIDDKVMKKLKDIAFETERFTFYAKPLSCFPTSSVLYLSPSPVTPIENLTLALYKAFPEYGTTGKTFPIYHMTIALGYPIEKQPEIIEKYIDEFGYKAIELQAGSLGIFVESKGEWQRYKSFELGEIYD